MSQIKTLTLQPCPDSPPMAAEASPTNSEAHQLLTKACNSYHYNRGGRQDIALDPPNSRFGPSSSDYSNRTAAQTMYTSFGPFSDKDTCMKSPLFPAGMQINTFQTDQQTGTIATTRACAGGTWSHIESRSPASAPGNSASH